MNTKIKGNIDNMLAYIKEYTDHQIFIRKMTIDYIREILDITNEAIDLSECDVPITYYGDCNTTETFYASSIQYDKYGNLVVCVDEGEAFMLEDLTIEELCDIWDEIAAIFADKE